MPVGGFRDEYLLDPAVERRVIQLRPHWAALVFPSRTELSRGRRWVQPHGLRPVLVPAVGVIGLVYVLSRLVSAYVPDLWLAQSLLWYIAVGAVIYFSWGLLEWWHWRLIITDKRCMIARGIIVRRNSMIPITKVTDLTFEQSFLGQLLGYGTLDVESAGKVEGLEVIPFVPMPGEVFHSLSELVFGDKKQARSHMLRPPPRRRLRMPGARMVPVPSGPVTQYNGTSGPGMWWLVIGVCVVVVVVAFGELLWRG